jgi:hypothetical protein
VSDLRSLFAPEVVAAVEQLVDERVAAALAARDREPQKRWLTAKEAGAYLGCSPRAIYMRKERKQLPESAIKKTGGRLMFDRLALDHALERT